MIIIPSENEKDLQEVPKRIRKGLEIIPVDHMDEVLGIVFPQITQTVFPDESLELEPSFHLKQ